VAFACPLIPLQVISRHHINNSIFGDGKDMISTSAGFFKNYFDTTVQIKNGAKERDRKGKAKIDQQIPKESMPMKEFNKAVWYKPQPGWLKINSDASFLLEVIQQTLLPSWDKWGSAPDFLGGFKQQQLVINYQAESYTFTLNSTQQEG
jgi:hypothetical protein